MLGIVTPVVTLLVVVLVGLLVMRVATVALTFTGLSRELARFQARSAFTGCGFTTGESESIVQHPVRRRIVMILMLLGNGTVVMAISSLIPIFLRNDPSVIGLISRLGWIGLGLLCLWGLSSSQWIDRQLSRIIGWALKRFTRLDAYDYLGRLHLSDGYTVGELDVEAEEWLAGKDLTHLRLSDEGVQVLGIHRADGSYVGTPTGDTYIRAGDTLILYGRTQHLAELERRPAGAEGDEAHDLAVAEQRRLLQKQQVQERAEDAGERAAPSADKAG